MPREMKDSGFCWLMDVPRDWKVCKVKHYYSMQTGFTPDTKKAEYYDDEYGYDWVNISDICDGMTITETKKKVSQLYIDEFSPTVIPTGSLLYSFKLSVGQTAFAGKPLYSNEAIATFLDGDDIDLHYLRYSSSFIIENAQTNIYNAKILNQDLIKNAYVPFPPIPEQHRIAAYLDSECAKIDDVITKTKATIEEYKKLKQSVITEAVTKGIKPDREMKDSRIEWIGEIPKEWNTSLIKYHLKWKSEKGFPNEQVLSLYRDYGVIPKDSRDDNHNVTSLDTSGYKLVDIGDFVINKMKAWQGSMAVSEYRGIISPAYHICEFYSNSFIKRYFHYLLRNNSYLPEYERLSTGMRTGQWDLGFDDFKNIPIIVPNLTEQQEIADYLDKKCSEIDTLIAKKEQIITELEGYKKSLIYEYVTGKKEV